MGGIPEQELVIQGIEMSETTDHTKHLPEHEEMYSNFIKGSIALCLMCAFILVALSSFGFGKSMPNLLGTVTIVAGLIAVLIDLRAGGKWFLSGGLLIVLGLLTGISVS
jgi:hypothetical protein